MECSFGVRKGAWTEEEDILLRQCVENYGEGSWYQIPLRAGLNRCRKSCRMRWLNYLKPNIKRGGFREDEVDLMIRLHKLLGNSFPATHLMSDTGPRSMYFMAMSSLVSLCLISLATPKSSARWSLIAGRLPGRTANDVKNFWNTHLRKKEISHIKDTKEKSQDIVKVNVIKPRPRTLSKNLALLNWKPTTTESFEPNDNASNISPSLMLSESGIKWWESLLDDKEGDERDIWAKKIVPEAIVGNTFDEDDFSCFAHTSFDMSLWDFLDA